MLIREVILENFMSYEYARIPFRSGVNVICGPNGSGKSSVLLGISVALGQSYTERSKKLSDLIRWGKDMARVTLVLDNSRRGRRRPVPRIKKDTIFLSRVLRRDGKYWFEIDGRAVSKNDVRRILSCFGVDPENLLIIMHQGMAEEFIILPPQEKLRVVEAAVGLESYRRNVLDARRKLNRIFSQEESINKLMESAKQTLNYWREQYDRYQEKKQLILKRQFLERELAWAEVSSIEAEISKVKGDIGRLKSDLEEIDSRRASYRERLERLRDELARLDLEWRRLLEDRLRLEGERARNELAISLIEEFISNLNSSTTSSSEVYGVNGQGDPDEPSGMDILKVLFEGLRGIAASGYVAADTLESLRERSNTLRSRLSRLHARISDVEDRMDGTLSRLRMLGDEVLDCRVELALLEHRRRNVMDEILEKEKLLKSLMGDLTSARGRAEGKGLRVATVRSVREILDEIRVTDGKIAAMADVSEDIERMYESYSRLYLELEEKARAVAENKERTLREVKARMESWRRVIGDLLEHVSSEYQRILSYANASGSVRLINEDDIESAGVEILVGFKGADETPLNAYTHSGGERSTATMAFLLALQRHVKSPFRAVDEYDVHMDPKNREVIANILISSLRGSDAQYLVITPNQIFFEDSDIHIITVQNVEGSSMVREVV